MAFESTQTSQADCVMWKDVPVLFFPLATPSVLPNVVKRILAGIFPSHTGCSHLMYPNSAYFQEGEQWGGGGGLKAFSPCL